MTNYKYLLFDVDGTIIESGPGVENSYQYALDTLGYNIKVKRKDILANEHVKRILFLFVWQPFVII